MSELAAVAPAEHLSITVTSLSGRAVQMELRASATLGELRSGVAHEFRADASSLRFVLGMAELHHDDTVAVHDAGITNGALLAVVTRSLTIHVATAMQDTFELAVSRAERVEDVRAKIEAQAGMSFGTQPLVCAGQRLEVGHTLSDYGIDDQVTLHVGMRISVRSDYGQTARLDVDPLDTVAAVKARAEVLLRMPAGEYELLSELGARLPDGSSLSDVKSKSGVCLIQTNSLLWIEDFFSRRS